VERWNKIRKHPYKLLSQGEKPEMLKALVITPNENTQEIGCLLAIPRAEARRREKSPINPPIHALRFFPELDVYVAVYEVEHIQGSTFEKR